jgi:tetratricopeptide (TPR) repeat protein
LKKCFLLLSLLLIYVSNSSLSFQKVTTKVKVYDDIFLTDSGLIPLPENAIELAREFTIKSEQFQSPIKLAADRKGNIYASAMSSSFVQKFNSAGEFLLPIGKKRNGKLLFQAPYDVHAAKDYLIIHDMGKKSLEFVDFQGVYIRSQKISEFDDFAVGENDRLYVAHYVQDKGSPLITVCFPGGKELSFGKPLSFHHSMQLLNSRSLAINEKGELYVVFTYLPIIRKYSSEGELLAEYKIENPIMTAKEDYNLKIIGEGIADITQRVGYKALIISIKAFGDKIYLLSHYPRLEITEMDDEGNCTATYWIDFKEVYETNDFAIQETNGEKKFYVSHSYPPHFDIDVFKKKKIHGGGLKAEIEELTDEIASYPDNYLSYNNRGVAKHRLGDYLGAINDFSKAIELAPDSGLAYNNRGLSRVKMEDIDGAISDFTKAIELNPSESVVFYNRGIALAHKKNYEKAIRDFERAAILDSKIETKAREQIDYCRTHLKNSAKKII